MLDRALRLVKLNASNNDMFGYDDKSAINAWADVLKKDLVSWRNPLKEPTIGKVKGPRQSKVLAIWDRVSEGMLCDGSICNRGGFDQEEAKGTHKIIQFLDFS